MTITDYHAQIRDAVVATIEGQAVGVPVVGIDDVDDISRVSSIPAIAVACVGPEQHRPEMETNAESGIGYSVAVVLLAAGVGGGEKSPEILQLTAFRRLLRTLFHSKRLPAVPQVGWCEVSDSGPLFDAKNPAFQKVSTAMVVTAVGRFPRV